nr:glycoside hydrolase family 32 protein [uncultured Blautia sp.]
MSTLTNVLVREVRKIEETAATERELQKSRLTHHLMPPTGWLNDPNGLCYFKGRYHVFFQYAPFDVNGGLKFWGHYSSEDMINWKYEGTSLFPDSVNDCHGVYSGSALVDEDKMHLFFTGNVKLEGDYDYINNGREASTLHIVSEDGVHFGRKEVAIHCNDYPDAYTCHIRDPKVWKDGDTYRMVLGGRKKGDHGAVLFYRSPDLKNWEFDKELTTEDAFGYMWECPDFFELSGEKILSTSPQGLFHEKTRFQNIYQSGYFILQDDAVKAENFREWDMGFDFYAPQTFEDARGRRILIGWMGMPDADDDYTNPTAEQENWQHCLTVPREVTLKNGMLYQWPVEEMNHIRGEAVELTDAGLNGTGIEMAQPFDLETEVQGEKIWVSFCEELLLDYADGMAKLSFSGKAGAGRSERYAQIPSGELHDIRILADTTAVEIYLNGGEVVFSTRYYPQEQTQKIEIQAEHIDGKIYKLNSMTVSY